MLMSLTTYGLSFIAGILSALSPCVLPLLPIILGSALNTHRWGPYALSLGLATSYTVLGVFLATFGGTLGLDQEVFRSLAAWLLVAFGIILLSPFLQEKFANMASGLSNSGQGLLNLFSANSLVGQFGLGLMLGLIWSPCVGPVLGATLTLASQGEQLGHVIMVMALFGIGAGLPLIVLGQLSHQWMSKHRTKLFLAGKLGKYMFGGVMLLIGLMTITGLDKPLEAYLVTLSPDWLVQLATRF